MHPKITALEMANYLSLTVQAVHKKIKVLDLSTKKSANKTFFGHNEARAMIKKPTALKKVCVESNTSIVIKQLLGRFSFQFPSNPYPIYCLVLKL